MQPFVTHSIALQQLADGHVGPFGDEQLLQSVTVQNGLGQMVHGTKLAKIPGGSLVIDCGAFIGDTAIDFQKHGWKVIAFEPFWDNYLCLVSNSPKSINIMAAVGNGGKVRLDSFCPGGNHGMRQLFHDESGIPTFRLDDLPLTQKVAFIKIDVEGMEYFVLEGAMELMERDSPILHIEVFPEKLHNHGISVQDLSNKLKEIGYGMEPWGQPPRWDIYCSKDIPSTSSIYPYP